MFDDKHDYVLVLIMMMMNYVVELLYANDDDIDECMYDNEDENDDDFVVEHVHCWVICSCIISVS